MYPPPRSVMVHGIAQVQHFVEHHVFERSERCLPPVENAIDDDGIVSGVEMPEQASRGAPAPPQKGPPQQSVEMLSIQPLEDLFQIMQVACRAGDKLPSADLPYQLRL